MDTMSYIDLTKVIKSIGYKAFKCLWYRHPRKALCKGLKPLNYDFNTLQLAEHVTGFDVVEVYVEDGVIDKCDKKLNDFKGEREREFVKLLKCALLCNDEMQDVDLGII